MPFSTSFANPFSNYLPLDFLSESRSCTARVIDGAAAPVSVNVAALLAGADAAAGAEASGLYERGVFRDEAIRPTLDEVDDVLFLGQHVHHDDAGMRRGLLDALDESLAAIASQRGVHEHDVGLGLLQSRERR